MKSTTIKMITVFLIALFPFVCLSAFAQTVVVPDSLENSADPIGSFFPFNCAESSIPSMRYQQVYLGSQFPQAGLIDKISYRLNSRGVPAFGPTVLPNVLIEMSTTQAQPNALSGTLADNVGPDVQVVFSGNLTVSAPDCDTDPCPFDVIILLQNPFFYNPADGNLLLDFRIPDCVDLDPDFVIVFDGTLDFPTITSTIYTINVNSEVATVISQFGLVTQFRITEEPLSPIAKDIPTISEWGLILTAGILGIIGLMVIRRRKLRV